MLCPSLPAFGGFAQEEGEKFQIRIISGSSPDRNVLFFGL
jgi:hypothetical protein